MKADLSGANLRTARNLTERQLYGAVGSAATILPPHLLHPPRWQEAPSEAHPEDLLPLDAVRQRGSTRMKLSWKTMLLCAGGAIAVVLVLLTVNLSIEQGASFESKSRRSENPLSPNQTSPEDLATAEPKLVAERPERLKDKPAATTFIRSAPEPD
jgi:hypothetical protein